MLYAIRGCLIFWDPRIMVGWYARYGIALGVAMGLLSSLQLFSWVLQWVLPVQAYLLMWACLQVWVDAAVGRSYLALC
jgi:hypothetical protein